MLVYLKGFVVNMHLNSYCDNGGSLVNKTCLTGCRISLSPTQVDGKMVVRNLPILLIIICNGRHVSEHLQFAGEVYLHSLIPILCLCLVCIILTN